MPKLYCLPAGKASKVMLVTFLVVAYSLCSSMLLILNKVNSFTHAWHIAPYTSTHFDRQKERLRKSDIHLVTC